MVRSWKMIFALCVATAMIAACVTVNIYFPAAKVQKAAEQIVDEVYGAKPGDAGAGEKKGAEPAPAAEAPKPSSSLGARFVVSLAAMLSPRSAWADDATTVSNANIRALKSEIASNHEKLAPHYAAGRVGIGNNGLLVVKSTEGLGLKDVAELKRVVEADNQARMKLYQEVAAALGIDPGQVAKVQATFAAEWIGKAPAGWWVQDASGAWRKK